MPQYTTQDEMVIATIFAKAVSTRFVKVSPSQASVWLFGGCALEEEMSDYLDSLAAVMGYKYKVTGYEREGFLKFITPFIGEVHAPDAANIIEDQF